MSSENHFVDDYQARLDREEQLERQAREIAKREYGIFWHEVHDERMLLFRYLVQDGCTAEELLGAVEKPHNWGDEYKDALFWKACCDLGIDERDVEIDE